MMMLRTQIFLTVLLILLLLLLFNMVRRRKLELKYTLAWLVGDIFLIILINIPDAMTNLARFLGIKSAMNMIFFLGFIFSLILIFVLTVSLSRVTARVRRLAQMIALNDEALEKRKEK